MISEHIHFHKMICDEGGKIFINPRFINCGLNEHSIQKYRIIHFIKFYIPNLNKC